MTIERRVSTLEERVNEIDDKLDLLVSIGERQLERIESLERQHKVLGAKVETLGAKVEVLDGKLDRVLDLLEN